jgi:diguanylate cyclase (GGDEF)-like protein/PAS domain S-box-containing protein
MLGNPLTPGESPGIAGHLLEKLNDAHVGVLLLDAALKILQVNEQACAIAGQRRDALIGRDVFASYCDQKDDSRYRAAADSLQNNGHWNGQISNCKPDGQPCSGLITIAAIDSIAGQDSAYLAILTDDTPARQSLDEIHHFAHYDALTGLPNRLLLMDRLEQTIASNRRTDSMLAVCFLDLDGFKHINDTLGHDAGDALLREVAQRMQDSIRSADTVARIGGDEFVVLLSVLDSEDECYQTIERLLGVISQPCSPLAGTQVQIGASIGVTIFPNDDSDGEALIRHADHAMYAAKRAGKNGYRMFDARMEQRLEARQDTLRRVSRAMHTGQFELHYQPTLNARSSRIIGVEALIRWNHPILGCLFPGEFIPLIEDDSAALELGEWVIREALRQNHCWHQRGIELSLTVNLFARQLQHPGFPASLARMIADAWPGMPAGKLILDIAEPTTTKALDTAQTGIRSCQEFGVHFHLNEFGAKDSALRSLRMLSLDGIKIYRSLINDMTGDTKSAHLVHGIIDLGKAFGLSITAQGVASEEHARLLHNLGCEIMQGYHISPPMTAAALEAWLLEFSSNSIRSKA